MTKEKRQYNTVKIVSSTNGTGTIGHQLAKRKKKDTNLYPSQKLIKMDHRPKCQMQNYKIHTIMG